MNDQDEIITLLRRNNELLAVLVKAQLRSVFVSELADGKKKKLYGLVGDSLTGLQMSKKLGMSTGAISGILKSWEIQGILVKEGCKYRRIFDA